MRTTRKKTGGSWVTIRRIRAQAIIVLIVVPTIETLLAAIWMAVKMMVPFWLLNIIRHLIWRVPKKGP